MSVQATIHEKSEKHLKKETAKLAKTKYITLTGILAAMITVMTAYV